MLQSNCISSQEVNAPAPCTPIDAAPAELTAPQGVEQPPPQPADVSQVPPPADDAADDVADDDGAVVPADASANVPGVPVKADSPDIPNDLDIRQRLALVSLARGSSMKKACDDAGIGRTTLYRWINEDPRFSAAYNRWKAVSQMSAHGQVLALQDLAAEVLREQLEFKRDAKLAARILEKTGALAPPALGPTHPGRAAAHLTADQREQDAQAAKHARDAKDAVQWIPNEFRFADNPEAGK